MILLFARDNIGRAASEEGVDVRPGQHRQAVMTDASVAGARINKTNSWHQDSLPSQGEGGMQHCALFNAGKTVDGAGAGNSGTHCSDYIVCLVPLPAAWSPERC